LGGQVIAFDGISVADKDFNAVLTRIRELNPQAIFFGGDYAGGGLLLRQARAVGIKAPMVLSEANLDPELLRVAGPAAEGAYITFLGAPPELLPNAKKFIADYKQRYPTDEMKAYDHYGYEAMAIAMDALKRSGPDREKLIVELTKTNYNGVLGQMRFDEKGDNYNRVVTLFQVKDGKFVPVK
jgi:branched-chain amino acid transport system substrate-binding protein